MVHNQRRRGQKSNANNQRVKKTNTDTHETTLYAWTSDRIFGEYDAQGNSIQETVYLGNTPVGILKPDGVYRIYADQIDTPRLITDDTNRPVWQWDAKPFGDSQPNEDLDGNGTPFHYNLRFPGQYYDAETKTHYNFNRDYDPETGRYIQSDPIGLDGGLNTYAYVGENPLIRYDQNGKNIVVNILRFLLKSLPVISFSKTTHPHVSFTILQGLSRGKPSTLTKCSACSTANRKASIGGLPPASTFVGMPGWSWDEYPFASTLEGGAGAFVNPVPELENSSQGGLLSAFYKANNLVDGDRFIVTIVP